MIKLKTKELHFDEKLKKKIEFICDFCNIKLTIMNKNNFTISNEDIDKIKKYIEQTNDATSNLRNANDIKIKHINFRKTFIKEYANLFNNKTINRNQVIATNNIPINIKVSAPMTREEIK